MRVVLDTNILIRANPTVLPERLARDLLVTVLSGPHVLVLSEAILTEVRRVMAYPRVQARWPLSTQAIERYTSFLRESCSLADLPQSFPAVVSDPDDDLVLQTAIAGTADVLCSHDGAFEAELVAQVCAAHGIRIIGDIPLLQELRRLAR
ncbi:MAG TPA: putative toxin-antitoxin system toxin component, PIN family [Candidatus Acidoferrum sp.]|nr:putative toxin-antitoxin system toxin component, PIN family [Candidatus Acidoferrum sp.]